jgi:lysozyme family protein
MQNDYTPFVDLMIKQYEGGYCWDKGDPGGPTKYGITCYDLAEHRGQHMDSMVNWAPIVKAMTLSEAEDIYKAKYATAIMFDQMPSGIDCVMMDYGVNSGTSRPIHVAQAMFKQPSSPHMTTALFQSIHQANKDWFINSMCDERLHFMHQIRGGSAWALFGKGWGARVNNLRTYSLNLANNAQPAAPAIDLSNVPTPKAQHEVPEVNVKHVITTSGAATASGAAANSSGMPWYFIAGAITVVIIAGVAYVIYRQHRATKANATVILPPSFVPQEAPHA